MTGTAAPAFTLRQLQVVEGLARGLSQEELADELGISHRTVRNYAERLRVLLDVDVTRRIPFAWRELTNRDPFTATAGANGAGR